MTASRSAVARILNYLGRRQPSPKGEVQAFGTAAIAGRLRDYETISFDIFDTAILRVYGAGEGRFRTLSGDGPRVAR